MLNSLSYERFCAICLDAVVWQQKRRLLNTLIVIDGMYYGKATPRVNIIYSSNKVGLKTSVV